MRYFICDGTDTFFSLFENGNKYGVPFDGIVWCTICVGPFFLCKQYTGPSKEARILSLMLYALAE